MADLKTDYKDDVLDTSVNEKRKYNLIQNEDGTVSLEDATVYSQAGDTFGAADVNETNKTVNALNKSLGGCWISFTDAEGNPTTEPYIHWYADDGTEVTN